MPKFLVSLTRDASEDGELVIEAKDENEARPKFLDNDYAGEIKWSEGDWAGDTQLVEILPYDDPKEPPAPRLKLKIEIDCSNAAFEDWGTARQARFILMNFNDSIAAIDSFEPPFAFALFDSNGNKVGEARVE